MLAIYVSPLVFNTGNVYAFIINITKDVFFISYIYTFDIQCKNRNLHLLLGYFSPVSFFLRLNKNVTVKCDVFGETAFWSFFGCYQRSCTSKCIFICPTPRWLSFCLFSLCILSSHIKIGNMFSLSTFDECWEPNKVEVLASDWKCNVWMNAEKQRIV